MSKILVWGAAIVLLCSSGCTGGTAGGGGGSFGSGGQAGTGCFAATQNQGCLGATGQQMVCDPASGQWQVAGLCPADSYCAEASDPAAPGTGKKVTACKPKLPTGGADVAAGDSGGASTDAMASSDLNSTGQGDVAIDDTKGDTAIQPDVPGQDACVPVCGAKECGPDGCGGQCGKCPAAAPSCVMGACEANCKPDCAGKSCGPDGCGAFCGNCPSGKPICIDGQCIADCTPACSGKKCGPDGCGGLCGSCAGDSACQSGQCVPNGPPIAVGEQCYAMLEDCAPGSTCVPSLTATGAECMQDKAAGQACGFGIGYCEPGSSCKFTSKDKAAMKCYPDGGVGAICNPYGAGECTDSSCMWTSSAVTTAKCYALGGMGASCGGVAKGLCKSGLGCIAVDDTAMSGTCLPEVPIGGECGGGIGLCALPGECVWATSSKAKAFCTAPGKAGEVCSTWGKSSECVPWYGCIPDSAASGSAWHCKPLKTIGSPCGNGIGYCINGLACVPNDLQAKTSTCRPAGPKGAVCAFGKSGCASGYTCDNSSGLSGNCVDACELYQYYNNGTCESGCVDPDPDCFQLGGG